MALVEIPITVARVGAPPSRLWHAVDGADVTVQNADGTPRTVYTDETGATVATQPLKSDNGRVDGWVEGGILLRYRAVKKGELAEPEPWQYFVSGGGPIGPQGSPGEQGPAGQPGEKWHTGAGAPAGATGIVGDWWLDSATADYYEKTGASAWTLRGNLSAPAPEAWHLVGAAGEPGFLNGWLNFGSGSVVAGFRKVGDRVQLRGLVTGGTMNTDIFVLPLGYRPLAGHHFGTASNGAYGGLWISSGGRVIPEVGSNAWFAINVGEFSTT